MATAGKSSWIHAPLADTVWIISPAFWPLIPILLFPEWVQAQQELSAFWWILFVVFIDEAHVYATMYRTYFSSSFKERKMLYTVLPLLAWVAGVILYSIGDMVFWRCLAYIAVFHFLRQQYGFLRIYSRHQIQAAWERHLDTVTIYTAMGYPLLFWHLDGERVFSWFVDGDIWQAPIGIHSLLLFVYAGILGAWCVKEVRLEINLGQINWPKWGVMIGTAVSWYMGIVYFNADWVFTAFNVMTHCIPYMALVWFYTKKEGEGMGDSINAKLMQLAGKQVVWGVALFLGISFAFAWLEEGLWDALVWRDHLEVFAGLSWLPAVESAEFLSLLVPLLALPQLTHYLLDGFIWKLKKGDNKWAEETLKGQGA